MQQSSAAVLSPNGSRATSYVVLANAMIVVFRRAALLPFMCFPAESVQWRNLTSPRCWNRTCFFPRRAAQRFDWWLTSRHRSHLFDILKLSSSFQQRHTITLMFSDNVFKFSSSDVGWRSVCLCNNYHGRHQRGGALLRHRLFSNVNTLQRFRCVTPICCYERDMSRICVLGAIRKQLNS